jgi:hypothetical protein
MKTIFSQDLSMECVPKANNAKKNFSDCLFPFPYQSKSIGCRLQSINNVANINQIVFIGWFFCSKWFWHHMKHCAAIQFKISVQ